MVMHREQFAVAVGEFVRAFLYDSRAVQIEDCLVALTGPRSAHELAHSEHFPCDFATVFQFVAFTDWRFHIK
ncbi:hypothetical protein WT72_12635 [Burkholderia pseudomultivorans]|nr:hypothetical protein WT72_12635 [Burkholderia pseudomultivorans]